MKHTIHSVHTGNHPSSTHCKKVGCYQSHLEYYIVHFIADLSETFANRPHLQYAVQLYCLVCSNAIVLIYIAMIMVAALVSSKQVVKPHSRLAVVKPEVLHLFYTTSSAVQWQLKCVWFSLNGRGLKNSCTLLSQPHLSKIPRSIIICHNYIKFIIFCR